MKKYLSIIIPVYNVEKYLNRCIDSIINQNNDEIEVLLIDDGSTDNSPDICDEYQKKYKNIFVYHKKNGGLSDARNYGLEKTNGEYIWFIDSDDYIENGSINKMIELIKKYSCDVYTYKAKIIDEKQNAYDECTYSIKDGKYEINDFFEILRKKPKNYIPCAPYYVFKKDICDKNGLKFYEGIIHEDELWTPQLLLLCTNIYFVDLYCYYHFMRSDSIMHSSKIEKSGKCCLIICQELNKIYTLNNNDITFLNDRNANLFLQAVWKNKSYFSEHSKFSRSFPLKKSYYIKTRIKALLYCISPYLYIKLHDLIKK